MEAPDKIYLQICGDCNDNDCENCKFEDLADNVTWCKDKIFKKDIEYIREDRTMLDKVYDFIIANVYKYGKVKFVDNRATFDFRMNAFLNDLNQAMEE